MHPRAALRARPRLLLLTGLALASTACAGLLAGYDVAPNGLARKDDALRRLLATGHADSALAEVAAGNGTAQGDELLRALYAGILAHYAGRYEASDSALRRAADLTEDRYTKRISKAAASLVTSDRVLPYEPGRTERLLIHYYGALNFLRRGDLEGAAVEARRIGFLLERDDREPDPRSTALAAFLRDFTGAVFEAAGEWNDADVAYRNALALRGGGAPIDSSLTRPLPDDEGEVVVIVEQGFVAHRVQQSVTLLLEPEEAKRLTGGETDDRLGAAALLATRILAEAAVAGERDGIWYGRRPRGIRVEIPFDESTSNDCDDEEDDDDDCKEENPYLLRIAWPTFRLDREPATTVRVVADCGAGAPVEVAADLSRAVVRDFEEERAAIVARTVARAVSKLALTRGLEKSIGEKDETAGQVVGLLTNLGTAALEQADTRSWQLLPGRIGLVRLRLPAGAHALTLEIASGAGEDAVRTIDLGQVDVVPGRYTFLSARIWQ
jgi:hypothetical protein